MGWNLCGEPGEVPLCVEKVWGAGPARKMPEVGVKKIYQGGAENVPWWEAARIDSVCECVRDFKDAYQKVRKLPAEEKENGMKEWFSETLVEKMTLLDNLLGHEDSNFSVGTKTSLADVVLFSFITQFFDNKEGALSSTDNLKVKNIVRKVGELNELKNWLSSRPETPF